MAFLLLIDSSSEQASVAVANTDTVLAQKICVQQKDHAAFLQPAIQELMTENGLHLRQLSAVAVTIGPGSYTGLRVALASAKGLCYALQLPLITLGTLEVMATALLQTRQIPGDAAVCPMIDARRQEVFMALYNSRLEPLVVPAAVVLQPNLMDEWLNTQPVAFCGSGTIKWQSMCQHPNASFQPLQVTAADMHQLAWQQYEQGRFASLAYAAPLYLKEVYINQKQ